MPSGTKSAGFVSFGSEGGRRAVEQLRQVLGQLKVADVGLQVALPLATEFIDYADFKPQAHREEALTAMLGRGRRMGGRARYRPGAGDERTPRRTSLIQDVSNDREGARPTQLRTS